MNTKLCSFHRVTISVQTIHMQPKMYAPIQKAPNAETITRTSHIHVRLQITCMVSMPPPDKREDERNMRDNWHDHSIHMVADSEKY